MVMILYLNCCGSCRSLCICQNSWNNTIKSLYILKDFLNCHYSIPSTLFPNSAWRFTMMRNLLFSEPTDHIINKFSHKCAVNGLQVVKILNISDLRQAGFIEPLFSTTNVLFPYIYWSSSGIWRFAICFPAPTITSSSLVPWAVLHMAHSKILYYLLEHDFYSQYCFPISRIWYSIFS